MRERTRKSVGYGAFLSLDAPTLASALALVAAGLVTMHSFSGADSFFSRQVAWVAVGLALYAGASVVDWRFLRRTSVVVALYAASAFALGALFLFGATTLGAVSRFDLGAFFVQPFDPVKLVLVAVLAKYFSRRHIEIAHWRHIVVSGLYVFALFGLLFLQPDFGGALVIFFIWLGMTLVSGLSKRHLAAIVLAGALVFAVLWGFVFAPYQKARIRTFVAPLTDLQGAGYNAYQSTVAVGSGRLLGKGVGFGTQSRLEFLPEYRTDFIFAAFAEEWGFLGALLLFVFFGTLIWRIVRDAAYGETNFETFFALGFAVLLASQFFVHVGMNIGLLPITGTALPFMSYGGSHLATEFFALGMLAGMRRYRRRAERNALQGEFVGPQ